MLALPTLDIGKQLTFRNAVAARLVRYDHVRHILGTIQQALEKRLARFCGARFLNQDVEPTTNSVRIQPSFWLEAAEPSSHFPRLRSS